MPIIRMVDQPTTPPGLAGRFQELSFQPLRAYREILGLDYVAPSGDHVAIPYEVTVPAAQIITYAVPHGLNRNSNGAEFDTHQRTPDIVIPMRVRYIGGAGDDTLVAGIGIMPAMTNNPAVWPSGMYADNDYVYISVINRSQSSALVRFFVYIEFTHSVITDEFYTGTQGSATVYFEDLAPA